jgi:hypothetical protein
MNPSTDTASPALRLVPPVPARTCRKHAARLAGSAPGHAVTWPEVLRALSDDEARPRAMALYRAGFSGCVTRCRFPDEPTVVWTPDAFSHRRGARESMADTLTAVEDSLEARRVRSLRINVLAVAIGAVRRRLEWELWP